MRLYRAGELHAIKFVEPLFLVEPIIPWGGIVMLHGPKTAGKTQLALTLGIAIAQGTPFLDEYTCRPGSVLMIEADMTKQVLQARVLELPGAELLHYLHCDPFDVTQLTQRWKATGKIDADLDAARQLFPTLVIVDSLRKTNTLDEINPNTPLFVYQSWRALFPGSTLVIIHHDRKKPTSPGAFLHFDEAASGSGAWLDDADTGLHLDRIRETKQGGHVATLSFSKCRTAEEPPPMVVRMDEKLMVRPTKPTARQRLSAWLRDNQQASGAEARNFLQSEKLCGRSVAYRLVAETGRL